VLRLFLAWRLIRMLSPILILAALALALSTAVRGLPATEARSQPAIARAVRGAERAIRPLILDMRHAISHALTGPTR
jgi:hypothetical protein